MTAYTINVCADCWAEHHGLNYTQPDDRVPLSEIDRTLYQTWDGCLECPLCECDYCKTDEIYAKTCDCPYGNRGHGFSWQPCDGCLSPLEGERFPLVVEERR